MKEEIYDIWDDVQRRTCKALVTAEDLERLNITEFNGRFRYTPYGDKYPFALNAKQLEMWMKEEYGFEVGYYEYHLVNKDGEVIFNITDTMVDDDMEMMRSNNANRGANMTEVMLNYVDAMIRTAEMAAENNEEFCGVVYDEDNVERELAIWIIARGLWKDYELG